MTDSSLTSRRQFLGAATALASTAALADPGPAPRGRVIDCQTHLFCPAIVARMEGRAADPRVFTRDGVRYVQMGDWLRKIPPHYLDAEAKIAAMDANGVDLAALSVNDPGPEWFGDEAPEVARIMNDFVASVVELHPTRFFGLAVLPLPHVDASLLELDRAVNELRFRGVLLYTNLAGDFPDDPRFRPVFAHAAKLGVPVLLHPAKPLTTDVVKGYEMTSSLGNMFDNTIALTRIILSGMLDELPALKLVCPHLGGTLPYIIGRIDHQTQVLKRGPKHLTRAPSEYLKQVWLDIVSPLPLAIRFGRDLLGAQRLLYASDHPWVDPSVVLKALDDAGLPADERAAILGRNAAQLFQLTA